MPNCKNCGQELQSEWKLCPICKTQVNINQQFERTYKTRRKNPNLFVGICLLIFGILFTLVSMGLLYYYSYYAQLEDAPPEGLILPSLTVAFGFIIIIGAIYMIWKKSKYLKPNNVNKI